MNSDNVEKEIRVFDIEKAKRKIRKEIEVGDSAPYTSDKKQHFLHSIAIALEALVEIESRRK